MRNFLWLIGVVCSLAMATECHAQSAVEVGVRDLERGMAIAEAAWQSSMRGTADDLWMADTYDTATGAISGNCDVWPYTAAIEAHCSILEAIHAAQASGVGDYTLQQSHYEVRLRQLVDNLEYYRGSYRLASYASVREWQPYAVPRAKVRGRADVAGILNVYDDQMWLCRELVRAYRLTGEEAYRDRATYLADYVIDGWDCWRDGHGTEYGGITWGPGYNSKHACSNAPIIQPLVWLSQIYRDSGETTDYYYRDAATATVVHATPEREDLYLEMARKIYAWQKEKLADGTGIYYDMMGAPEEIVVSRGYRQHVECGDPGGRFFSYNTGTMIGGGAELYAVEADEGLKADMEQSARRALTQFAHYVRKLGTYEFNTDAKATEGFSTWFNDVLMRGYIVAEPYLETSAARNAIEGFEATLDYAYDHHLRQGLLPVRLVEGWGDESLTKAFHQFTFASQYAQLAKRQLEKVHGGLPVALVPEGTCENTEVNLQGMFLGPISQVKERGMYILVGARPRRALILSGS